MNLPKRTWHILNYSKYFKYFSNFWTTFIGILYFEPCNYSENISFFSTTLSLKFLKRIFFKKGVGAKEFSLFIMSLNNPAKFHQHSEYNVPQKFCPEQGYCNDIWNFYITLIWNEHFHVKREKSFKQFEQYLSASSCLLLSPILLQLKWY